MSADRVTPEERAAWDVDPDLWPHTPPLHAWRVLYEDDDNLVWARWHRACGQRARLRAGRPGRRRRARRGPAVWLDVRESDKERERGGQVSDKRVSFEESMRATRRSLGALRASMQRMTTALTIEYGEDWEARYLAEGVRDLENRANGESA